VQAKLLTRKPARKDSAHHLHPFTDFKGLSESGGSRVIVRGDGVKIWDSEGHEIIDAMSGLWCVNLGYGRRDLIDAATAQLNELPFYNGFFSKPLLPLAAGACCLLAEVSPPGFNHVFFANSGSEGNGDLWCAWCAAIGI